jgi:SAM-dependent methyltransferase
MNRAMSVAARLSEPSRMRYAGDVFNTGKARRRDRLVSSAYWMLSTPTWGYRAVDDVHLAPFRLGLEALATTGVQPAFVVDVGTGAGASAAMLARQWSSARVEAIDSSWRMLRRARSLHKEPNLRFRRASALSMPYDAGSVDLLTCLNAIAAPSEMRRVCAPGAHVLAAGTWVPLRGEDSDWVQRFAAAGLRRIDSGSVGGGSWELYAVAG